MRITRRNISYLLCAATLLLGIIGATITRAAIQYRASDVNMLAIVLYKEVGSVKYSDASVQRVANVIMNRYKAWGGKVSIGDILTQRWGNKKGGQTYAFSGVSTYLTENTTDEQIVSFLRHNQGERCIRIAQQALSGQLRDLTQGATAYRTCIGGQHSEASRQFNGAGTRVDVGDDKEPHCYYKNYALGGFRDTRYGKAIIAKEQSVYGSKVTYNGKSLSDTDLQGDVSGGGDYESGADSGGFTDLSFTDERYENLCRDAKESGAKESNNQFPSATFSPQILAGMQKMMLQVYDALSQLYIYGNALMCYATNVAYTCIGFDVADMCIVKMVNLSFWLSGGAIYLTAFFMTLAIGMYFIDVTFKIGFAVLFLPISIALWPFEPTSKKFMDNIGIILHNAMLFAFVSIGVSFAVALIHSVTFNGVIDQAQFAQALADDSGKEMSQNFSIDADVFLLVIFSILVGLKIIQSSVKDYLSKIFPDNIFGSASPMMNKGTQALGFIKSRAITPATKLISDTMMTQGGKGIQKLGNALRGNSNPTLTPNIPSGGGQGGIPSPTGGLLSGSSSIGPSAAQTSTQGAAPSQSSTTAQDQTNPQNSTQQTQGANDLPQGFTPMSMDAGTLAAGLASSAIMGGITNKNAPISLAPGAIFSNRNILLQAETYQSLGRFAQSVKQKGVITSCQEALASLSKNPADTAQKVIMKGSQIFVRTVLETAGSAIYSAGRGIEAAGPGKNMAPRTDFRGTRTQQAQTQQPDQQQPTQQTNQATAPVDPITQEQPQQSVTPETASGSRPQKTDPTQNRTQSQTDQTVPEQNQRPSQQPQQQPSVQPTADTTTNGAADQRNE